MIFKEPKPFTEAINSQMAKMLMPTDLRSKWMAHLPAALKDRAFFSATVDNARVLDRLSAAVDDLLQGGKTRDSERALLKRLLDDMGAPKLSDARLNLILDTNVQLAEGYGHYAQGQDQGILDVWPAQELFRIGWRKVPRDWAERWQQVGGTISDGDRMAAMKNDEIWDALGDPDNFDDALGNPYPPFAFNSGMDVEDVSRDDAVEMGLMNPTDRVDPQDRGVNEDLEMDPGIRDTTLRSVIADFLHGIAKFTPDGVLRFTGAGS